MKGKEGSGDPEGREAKSGLASSGRGLDTSGEKGFFADVKALNLLQLVYLSIKITRYHHNAHWQIYPHT